MSRAPCPTPGCPYFVYADAKHPCHVCRRRAKRPALKHLIPCATEGCPLRTVAPSTHCRPCDQAIAHRARAAG